MWISRETWRRVLPWSSRSNSYLKNALTMTKSASRVSLPFRQTQAPNRENLIRRNAASIPPWLYQRRRA